MPLPLLLSLSLCIESAKVGQNFPKTMDIDSYSPRFRSVGQILLFNFHNATIIQALSNFLHSQLLNLKIFTSSDSSRHEVNVVMHTAKDNTSIDDAISAEAKKYDFNIAVDRKSNCVYSSSHILRKTKCAIILSFCEDSFPNEDNDLAYKISAEILDTISSIFGAQPSFKPRISLSKLNDSIVVFETGKISHASIQTIEETASNYANLSIRNETIGADTFNVLCSICPTSSCAASYIRRIPEYINSIASGELPIFLLPPACSIQYASSDLAFAPSKNPIALAAVVRKALFGYEANDPNGDFLEIIGRRNIGAATLIALSEELEKPVKEIKDLLLFSVGFNATSILNEFDPLYKEYEDIEKRLIKTLMMNGTFAAKSILPQLVNASESISERWLLFNQNVRRVQQCVGNLYDNSYSPPFIVRPSFYFILSFAAICALCVRIFSEMRMSQVISMLKKPSPLL